MTINNEYTLTGAVFIHALFKHLCPLRYDKKNAIKGLQNAEAMIK